MAEEYISRKAVRDAIASLSIERFELSNAYRLYVEALDNVDKKVVKIPAASVAPIVRCKDCKWCHSGYCEKYDDLIPFGCANKEWENWFCADGERKNNV